MGSAEFAGGLLLAVGLLTPFGAAAVTGVMTVAIATVHVKNGFFNTNAGYEFNLVLIASSLALAFSGPGRFSLDRELELTLSGSEWGLAAAALGIASAFGVLALRRAHQTVPTAQERESMGAA